MLLLRCCRADRLLIAIDEWIETRLGEAAPLLPSESIEAAANDGEPCVPIVLTLHGGCNVLPSLRALGTSLAKRPPLELYLSDTDDAAALERIEADVDEAVDYGRWVVIHDMHLAPHALLHRLTTILLGVRADRAHANFRLWATTAPTLVEMPLALSSRARLLAIEPPQAASALLAYARGVAQEEAPVREGAKREGDATGGGAVSVDRLLRMHTVLEARQALTSDGSPTPANGLTASLRLALRTMHLGEASPTAARSPTAEAMLGALRDTIYHSVEPEIRDLVQIGKKITLITIPSSVCSQTTNLDRF